MKTFCIQTLGCKVNHYESEQIAELLHARGLQPSDAASADLRIVNSCSVTLQAASQSRQSVRRLSRLPLFSESVSAATEKSSTEPSSPHRTARRPRTLVTGCWATSNTAEASALPASMRY